MTSEVAASVLYILLGKEYVDDTFTSEDLAEIAGKADTVREAILGGHEP